MHIQELKSLTFTITDSAPPTVSLIDNDSDNVVVNSDAVIFTATFSEAMTPTPTISLSGIVTNAFMSLLHLLQYGNTLGQCQHH